MKHLNQSATKVFKRLIDGVTFDRMAKFDNAPGCYMPVSVERINETPCGHVYSVTHYGEQNRDMMCDPDMTFLVSFADGNVYPCDTSRDIVTDNIDKYPFVGHQGL